MTVRAEGAENDAVELEVHIEAAHTQSSAT